MLKLIIADDEKNTRDGLKQYIPWNDFGITTVETARNGLHALELAMELKPDIVITDVRMPKMDGIQMAMKLREFLPNCRIIFLSGYSDKEYLKSAIQLKAVRYIEKPVNIGEIRQSIKETAALCMEELKERAEKEKIKISLQESIPLIRQEIALELVKEDVDVNRLAEKYGDPVYIHRQDLLYTAFCILLNWNSGIESERANAIRHSIALMFCDCSIWHEEIPLAGFSGHDRVVLIIYGIAGKGINSADTAKRVMERLTELSQGCFSVSIGIGTAVREPEQLHLSYREACAAAMKQFYQGVGRIYPPQGSNPADYVLDKHIYPVFRKHLREEDQSGASDCILNLVSGIQSAEGRNINAIKDIFFNLMLILVEVSVEWGLAQEDAECGKCSIWHTIDRFGTLSELSEYMMSGIRSFFKRMDEKEAVCKKACEVKRYIREHYTGTDLTIQTIADHFYLSRTYLCSFFRKATGRTINDYITQVRIEKAKELLKDGRNRLYEISHSVGLNDANYFSSLFKKCVGCSPSEYRERLNP